MFASHDDFGDQGTGFASPGLRGFWRAGPMPQAPVELVLRRGIVLRGRAVDAAGRAFACDSLMLVPEYNGSGPPRIEAKTDGDGHFAFRRAVLENFEIVPHSLDHWRPTSPGNYLRITQVPQSWVATARAGGSIDIRVEPYTLVGPQLVVSEDAKRLLTTLRQRLGEIAALSKSEEGLKRGGDLDLRPLLGLARQTLRDALGPPSIDCRDKPSVNVTTGERERIAPCQADEDLAYSFYRLPKGTTGGGPELLLQFNPRWNLRSGALAFDAVELSRLFPTSFLAVGFVLGFLGSRAIATRLVRSNRATLAGAATVLAPASLVSASIVADFVLRAFLVLTGNHLLMVVVGPF